MKQRHSMQKELKNIVPHSIKGANSNDQDVEFYQCIFYEGHVALNISPRQFLLTLFDNLEM